MRLKDRNKRPRSMRSTLARKLERIRANREAIETILIRGAVELPEDYLVVHQKAEPETTAKIVDQAEKRRGFKRAKRALEFHGCGARPREADMAVLMDRYGIGIEGERLAA